MSGLPPHMITTIIPSISSFRKENIRNANNINTNSNEDDSSMEKNTSAATTAGLRLRLDLAKTPTTLRRGVLLPSSSSSREQYRLLRSGETLESLFCLSSDTDQEHRDLCHEIAFGTKAEDGTAWLTALRIACRSALSYNNCDLLRLHKRACVKLHITVHSSSTKCSEDVRIQILLSFAQAHIIQNDDKEEARKKYQDILLFGLSSDQAFVYLQISEFYFKQDKNMQKAIETLQLGIHNIAQPMESIQRQLDQLLLLQQQEQKTRGQTFKPVVIPPLRPSSSSALEPASTQVLHSNPHYFSTTLRTKLPMIAGNIHSTSNALEENNKPLASSAHVSTSAARDYAATLKTHIPPTTEDIMNPQKNKKSVMFAESTKSAPLSLLRTTTRKRNNIGGALRVTTPNKGYSSDEDDSSDFHANPNNGLHEGTNNSSSSSSSTSTDDDNNSTNRKKYSKGTTAGPLVVKNDHWHHPPPKITKSELSYMLNWDPDTYRKRSKAAADSSSSSSSTITTNTGISAGNIINNNGSTNNNCCESTALSCVVKKQQDNIGHILEKHPTNDICSANNHEIQNSFAPQKTPGTSPSPDDNNNNNNIKLQDPEINAPNNISTTCTVSTTPASTEQKQTEDDAISNKLNPDFVNLARNENMIHVNNLSYAKLGVMGQGASCKVYRALSKDCQVLAIKKVKLEGKERGTMVDSQTIEMYKNEIALLKSLSGNPSIIQMFDSEVDLNRKAIYIVMEVGEVDLNYVLQQQAKLMDRNNKSSSHRSSTRTSSLNMNFIRLTWQQMLSAVYSIHTEHSIVHGDLKPANFLFVKGALKLIDFGIAKAIQTDDTTNIYRDSQIGTLNYMSPEAIMGTSCGTEGGEFKMKLGRASDIWSLGCILYQMVYGKTPFADLHMLQKIHAITDPSHKINYPPSADEAAVDAIQLCLKRKAEERPPIVGKNGLLNEHWFLHARRFIAPEVKL